MIFDFESLSAAQVVAQRTAVGCLVSGFHQAGLGALAPCLPGLRDIRRTRWSPVALAGVPVPHGKSTPEAARASAGERAQLSCREDFVLDLYLRDVTRALRAQSAPEPGKCPAPLFDDEARERLVLHALRDVVRIAVDYRGMGLPVADLINEGNIGLLRAAELYDPNRRVRFAHYARPWIRVQMQRALSYQAWPVNFPADFAWRHGKVCRTAQNLKNTLERAPGDSEVARACGMGISTVHRLRATPTPTFIPIDAPFPGDEPGITFAEVIPDENAPAPDREAERTSERQMLQSLLKVLSRRERKVVRLRYGLDDGQPRTLQDVAQAFGYVRQGVHRLESAALTRLRKHARFLGHSGKAVEFAELRRPASGLPARNGYGTVCHAVAAG